MLFKACRQDPEMVVNHRYTKLPDSTAEIPDENEKLSLELSPDEDAVLARQLHGIRDGTESVNPDPWAYTTTWDIAVLVLSFITAIAAGAANPLLVVSPPHKDVFPRPE